MADRDESRNSPSKAQVHQMFSLLAVLSLSLFALPSHFHFSLPHHFIYVSVSSSYSSSTCTWPHKDVSIWTMMARKKNKASLDDRNVFKSVRKETHEVLENWEWDRYPTDGWEKRWVEWASQRERPVEYIRNNKYFTKSNNRHNKCRHRVQKSLFHFHSLSLLYSHILSWVTISITSKIIQIVSKTG